MKKETREKIKVLIKEVILLKLEGYNPETEHKPFFEAIFTKEQVLTHSIVHSFYTSFGTSIYEQLAKLLAEGTGYYAEKQYKLGGQIDQTTENVITKIHMDLRSKNVKPDMKCELEEIKKTIKLGKSEHIDPDKTVDLYIKKPNGEEAFFDITSVKPNKKEFVELKRKLLRWTALRLSMDKNARITTALAIPYNPYHPKPYARWTKENMYDTNQLMIGKDFWNFVAGEDVYDEFLEIFKEVGKELRERIEKLATR